MKKFLSLFLVMSIFAAPSFAADQWDTTDPAGSSNASDIDTNIIANNEALDRALIRYRRGLGVNYSTAATLSVLAGEIAIPDSSDGTVRWRRTTAATSVGWSDIDTGAEASSTTYYVYATADTDITGMVFKISASSSAPSGSTYYRNIATFYNNSSSNIERVISLRQDDGTDYKDVAKAWIVMNGTGTVSISKSYNVSSITDNGTGDYTITFVTSFADTTYVPAGTVGAASDTFVYGFVPFTKSTGSFRFVVRRTDTASVTDISDISIAFFGDRV